jgi:hypothetical protein
MDNFVLLIADAFPILVAVESQSYPIGEKKFSTPCNQFSIFFQEGHDQEVYCVGKSN